ncbi:hypothetical protein FRC00_002052 [Tulasnella sp. 408]|nr:hypothetical protein FRC00_002052 [Tulasnella sp. 408]
MEIGPANLELSGISQPVRMDFLSYLNLDIYKRDSLGGLVRMMRQSIAVTETKVSVDYCTLEICAGGGQEVEIEIEDEPQLALSEFIKVSIAALAASPAVTLVLKENFSYKWTMHVISALAPLRSITALKFLGWIMFDDVDDVCNPLDCIVHVKRQIQHAFPRLQTLHCCVNTVSELESLRQVVLCRNQTTPVQEKAELLPLKEVDISHGEEWGLQDCCNAIFDEMQALIPGGNLKVMCQRWRTRSIA